MATIVPPPVPPPSRFAPPPQPPAPPKIRRLRVWQGVMIVIAGLLYWGIALSLLVALAGPAPSTPSSTSSQQTVPATQAPATQPPTAQPTKAPTQQPTQQPTQAPSPTATPKPAPTVTPKPAPARLTLDITSATIVRQGTGEVSVHTFPNATLTIRVHYNQTNRDATSKSLKGKFLANASGNHTWTWNVQSKATGTALVTVIATWHGQTTKATTTVHMQ